MEGQGESPSKTGSSKKPRSSKSSKQSISKKDKDRSSISVKKDKKKEKSSKEAVKIITLPSYQGKYAPIIFLDIDGVLNRTKSAKHIRLDEDLVGRFRGLVETSGANIVLSTYWRHFREYISFILSNYGIPEERILGSTPGFNRSMKGRKASDDSEYTNRAEEIRAWIKEYQIQLMDGDETGTSGDNNSEDDHNHEVRFVILDDRPTAADDTEYLQSRFIHCDTTKGLTEEDVERAIRILQASSQDGP